VEQDRTHFLSIVALIFFEIKLIKYNSSEMSNDSMAINIYLIGERNMRIQSMVQMLQFGIQMLKTMIPFTYLFPIFVDHLH